MGISMNTDIVPYIARCAFWCSDADKYDEDYLERGEDLEYLCIFHPTVLEETHHYSDELSGVFSKNGWELVKIAEDCGRDNNVYGTKWFNKITGRTVILVNESEDWDQGFAEIGIISDNPDAIRSFYEAFIHLAPEHIKFNIEKDTYCYKYS
jgi:hypothetical protein